MINSLNSLEFLKPKLITMDKFNCPATTKLLPPSSLTQTRTFVKISGHHHNQQQLHHFNNNNSNNTIDSQQLQKRQEILLLNNEIKQQEEQERVKVQYVKNLTKLQNLNCWRNSRTLNNTKSASYSGVNDNNKEMKDDTEIDVVNVEHLSPASKIITPINIQQQQSAFNLDLKSKNYLNNNNNNNISICVNENDDKTKKDSSRIIENNNNYKFYNQYGLLNNNQTTTMTSAIDTLTTSTSPTSIITQRTEDQNNAYRHIESVHNYAKSKSYEDDDDNQSPNGSRHSSYLDDDDEEEDDDDEEDNDNDVDYDQDDDIDYEERLDSNVDDLDADYEHIFNRSKQRRLQKLSTSSDGALLTKSNRINNCRGVVALDVLKKSAQLNVNRSNCLNNNAAAGEDEEIHVDVDVETIESQSSSPSMQTSDMNRSSLTFNGIADESAATIKPDHHARRPMNAFLIFCKRHRAIVKERYKNLENRAITKILGDWWASLDANDKKCFTNLAQQNKDAFFSANPNFKWYKLPAPPLRTLSTRPATNQDYQDDNESNAQEIISNNNATRGGGGGDNHSNYFKLADEAQMGDLSQLMQDKTKTNMKQCTDLQQALGETSQFMSAHITGNSDVLEENQNHLKRRYHNENSFSSNSSEDDVLEPKRKTARSCKGKRYQELINSGQIATAVKKSSKSSTERLAKSATGNGGNGVGGGNVDNSFEGNLKQSYGNVNNFNNKLETNVCQKRSISECETLMSYDLNGFDLEERIKELPALNLDDYLQRKRNTKKKKKFSSNGKKRGQRSSNHNNNNNNNNESNLNKKQISNESLLQKLKATPTAAAPPTAVGSQKRKARKESITRRDVSAIEQEVASLLPLTINGCCYLQAIEKDTETTPSPQTLNVTSTTSPIIPLQQKTSTSTSTSTTTSSVSIDIFNNNNNNNTLNDNISSSTSDLLILAEVAANRTEL